MNVFLPSLPANNVALNQAMEEINEVEKKKTVTEIIVARLSRDKMSVYVS